MVSLCMWCRSKNVTIVREMCDTPGPNFPPERPAGYPSVRILDEYTQCSDCNEQWYTAEQSMNHTALVRAELAKLGVTMETRRRKRQPV